MSAAPPSSTAKTPSQLATYADLFDRLRDCILLVDPKTELILEINNACEDILGLAPETMVGLSVNTWIEESGRTEFRKALRMSLRRYYPRQFEMRWRTADGRMLHMEISSCPLTLINNETVLQLQLRDITFKREAEAKLTNTAKMSALGEMAGGIAHEINTPLGTIGMIAEQIQELVSDEAIDRKTVTEMTEIVATTVKRIGTIIQGLKTFSRDGSRDPFASAPLQQILDDTLALCSEKLKQASVKIQVDPIPEGLNVRCRSVQIAQVLLNLIGNSCDATVPLQVRWIRITIEKQNKHVHISVTDSGSGVPESIRSKIFQPFFTTKEIGKGTGLGLSISKGIMVDHGGKLELDAKYENTRFVLTLPEGEVLSHAP